MDNTSSCKVNFSTGKIYFLIYLIEIILRLVIKLIKILIIYPDNNILTYKTAILKKMILL